MAKKLSEQRAIPTNEVHSVNQETIPAEVNIFWMTMVTCIGADLTTNTN
jgi:hypothetical protein